MPRERKFSTEQLTKFVEENPDLKRSQINPLAREYFNVPEGLNFGEFKEVMDLSKNLPVTDIDSPIDSSEEIRTEDEERNVVGDDIIERMKEADERIEKILGDIESSTVYGETAAGKADFEDLQEMRKNLGLFSPEEEARVRQAGEMAGAKFVPLIGEAEEQKRLGMPKAKIRAGERGGFLSTQFAGAAALTPTEGGTFVGAGGELENIQSVYDRNISNLKAQKQSAINAAEAQMRTYIRTGKRDDFNAAMDLFEKAQTSHNSAVQLAIEKVDAIKQVQDLRASQLKYIDEQAEAQLSKAAESALSQLTGDLTKDKDLITSIATEQGIDPNRLQTYVDDLQATKTQEELELVRKRLDIAEGLEAGETYTDPGTGITIVGRADPETMDVVQTVGNTEYQVRYKMVDGEPVEQWKITLGPRWKGGGTPTDTGLPNIDGALTETVNYLDGLKETGEFNDVTYNFAINELLNNYEGSDREQLQNHINQRLEALERGGEMETVDDNMEKAEKGTETTDEYETASAQLGEIIRKGTGKVAKNVLPVLGRGITELSASSQNFLRGLVGIEEVPKEEVELLRKIFRFQ